MFFTECANLAERHPNLAAAIQKIDAQLSDMGTAEVIRVDDFASFLGIDPNQANAVFEKLAQEKLLLVEEMVECARCCMAALRSEYQEQIKNEGEYCCTSCERPLTDKSAKPITTYRRGEKWQEISNPSDSSGDTSHLDASPPSIPSNMVFDEQAYYTHDRLAEIFNVGKEALRKRLDRYRERHFDGWKVNEDRRSNEPKFLYMLKDVKGLITELKASSKRPAK